MLVRNHMSTPAVTIASDADYKTALRLMQENGMHHVPVVDAAGRLVGIAAERDLLRAATHYLQSAVEIGDIMHRGVVTVSPETPITRAAALMVEKRIGGLPVVDESDGVIGIITETDIFRALVRSLDELQAA